MISLVALATSLLVVVFLSYFETVMAFSSPSTPMINMNSFTSSTINRKKALQYHPRFHIPQNNRLIGDDNHRLADASSIGADGDKLPIVINTSTSDTPQINTKETPFPLVLWRFTRPHTIIGSAIAIPSIFLLAAPTYASFFTQRCFMSLIYAAIPSLFMNLYITGLNQITDVEIDKINKPYLPLASGELKYSSACVVVLIALAISLAMSVMHPILSSSGLQVALWGSFVLGTMYSLPPFRMKKHPLLAAFCIVAVRGTIINAGFYSHAVSTAFGSVPQIRGVLGCLMNDYKCALSSAFFGVFGIVIALMKDVPDAHGDRIFNIRSFTVRLGQKRVFNTMKNLLTMLFGIFGTAMIRYSTLAQDIPLVAIRRGLVGLVCLIAGWSVNKEARGVNAEDSGEVYNYYMFLWKLFYGSYFVLPFAK